VKFAIVSGALSYATDFWFFSLAYLWINILIVCCLQKIDKLQSMMHIIEPGGALGQHTFFVDTKKEGMRTVFAVKTRIPQHCYCRTF